MKFDPHLIRFGVLGLVFVGRAIAAANRKRQAQNRTLQPPQGGPLSSSLNSAQEPPLSPQAKPPLPPQAPPSMSSQPQRKSKAPDSPWSDLK